MPILFIFIVLDDHWNFEDLFARTINGDVYTCVVIV